MGVCQMNFKKKMSSLALVVLFSFSSVGYAQDNASATKAGPRKQISGIFLSGMAGAVLGLSTLSFYGRPQDELGNIAIGFALGAVIGTLYTTYDTATQPEKYFSQKQNFLEKTDRVLPLFAYQYDF